MKKSPILVLVAAIAIALCITLVPKVFSQIENVQVLSYSQYSSPYSSDYIIVVGEAQNTGPNMIDYIIVTGTFYAADGTPLIANYDRSLITQILPQQKTPFYLSFSPQQSLTGDYYGDLQHIENFTISIGYAQPTDSRQYQDLEISSHASSYDSDGYYMVTGVVKNTGTQSTNKTWVVATFYNSTGSVVALGYSDYLTPSSITPGGTASFTIYPLDYTAVIGKISSYSLLIQTLITTPSTTPTPSPSASPSPSPTSPSGTSSPTPTEPGNGTAIPDTYVYAAVAVVIIVIAIGVFALLRRKRVGGRAIS
jgi:hypothetical protein